ncbi:hypothetical protein GV794_10820 [Nocardia cyriacigeorgica]|uniref:Uncharacterized protein n=2 Tax=Nocardia cyriacigeorgica TaxID=135487 RepID=A0A6P1D7Q4_9NOCA|nr:hypothetical protein [Nocardia cyriacigeorgica]NEW45639.1 hypothetical protein [Nocardia cyriacigeorgica]NEW48856.1 hypothetical protein [Nocardia cyriacigeorgica]NEW56141.1 hypothetical protein [Nocardia cyriacigeorgica]
MVSEAKLRSALAVLADDADSTVDHYSAACALESFGVAIRVHADDVDCLDRGYESLLATAAEIAGGAVTITNVRLVEDDDDVEESRLERLEFERNGTLVSIVAEHYADGYYDHTAACEAIAATADDDDPRSWRIVDFERAPNRGYDSIIALATPEQAQALGEHLGFTLT